MRPGFRGKWPVKIIETVKQTLARGPIKTDPFKGKTMLVKEFLANIIRLFIWVKQEITCTPQLKATF